MIMNTPPEYSSLSGVDEPVDLPSYTPALLRYDIVLYKRELKSPSEPITEWKWHLAIVELNSTQLNIYKVSDKQEKISKLLKKILDFKTKVVAGLNKLDTKFLNDSKFGDNKLIQYLVNHEDKEESIPYKLIRPYIGDRINTYTLQYARIGAAKDTRDKRRNVLRMRLELEQYLVVMMNKAKLLKFNVDFKIGRCISMAVDDRVVKDHDLTNLETLLRFNGWKGMVCLPWDEHCERKFSSLKKYEKLFFYFDEINVLKSRAHSSKTGSCKNGVLNYKTFIIKDLGIEEFL